MAQRLSCEERAWIEAMRAVGVSVEETARRLGRHRSTVYRELDRNSRHGRYGAHAAPCALRQSTRPAMTTAARGACPRVRGGVCRGAAANANSADATRDSQPAG